MQDVNTTVGVGGAPQGDIHELQGQVRAIRRSQAVIEFNLDGTILWANDLFLNAVGYTLDEIRGQHHRMFVESSYAASSDYAQFWQRLGQGQFESGEYKRLGKGGKEIWILATYNPILDDNGNATKVVKFATDVTEQKLRDADFQGQINAIGKAQAVIEFNMDGTIISANDNFLNAMGYSLEEIQGRHHEMFVEPSYGASPEYRQFWATLNDGKYQTGEYKRIGKGGREVWIQASYNPILDLNGKPFKVVKYASDVTEQKLQNADYEGQIQAISKAQAVIEFNMDGTIIWANQNFLDALGYSLHEIQGKHHRLFVESEYGTSPEYRFFWDGLNRGEYQTGQYKRLGKGGKEVWIQASYNPILDLNGNPFKVVKYASDITQQTVMNIRYRKELGELIDACKSGDLSKRGDESALDETYAPLMRGTNEVIEAIVAPVYEAASVLELVAQQDLTVRVEGDYLGDHAALKNNLNSALDSLETALLQAREAASQVRSASGQIASGSQSLADGASSQASSLEQISASLEELTAMTGQNADNAAQANTLAQDAQTVAGKGREAMARMSEAITKIQESAGRTGKIIKTIDEIAFQTNLLALNAAVEAARAGDAGKGFAVVAEEVRSLAARSAEAAKNTADLIEQSGKNAEGGVRISEDVAGTLHDIVDRVDRVGSLISEIAAASKEQSLGLNQINDGVSQLDTVTQTNAANSEESAAAAEELNAQSESLTSMIESFRLSGGANAAGRPTARPRSTAVARQASGGGARGNGHGVPAPRARATVRPEDVIPLDDSDLENF